MTGIFNRGDCLVILSSYGERCGGKSIAMVDLKIPQIHVWKLLEF